MTIIVGLAMIVLTMIGGLFIGFTVVGPILTGQLVLLWKNLKRAVDLTLINKEVG